MDNLDGSNNLVSLPRNSQPQQNAPPGVMSQLQACQPFVQGAQQSLSDNELYRNDTSEIHIKSPDGWEVNVKHTCKRFGIAGLTAVCKSVMAAIKDGYNKLRCSLTAAWKWIVFCCHL